MRFLSAFLLVLALGCTGGEGDGVDAGTPVDAGAADAGPADGGTADGGSCAGTCVKSAPGDCACFSNEDCAAVDRCVDHPTESLCECGARGTAAFDAACTGSNDCQSGVCVEHRCSRVCTGDGQCGGGLPRCSIIGVCVP